MVFAALLVRSPDFHGRGPAHSVGRRSPVAGDANFAPPDASQTSTPQSVFTGPPKSVKALASVLTLFGLIIIVFVVWRIGVWRRKRRLAAATSGQKGIDHKPALIDIETGYKVETGCGEKVLTVSPPGEGTVWVPMVRPFHPNQITVPPIAKKSSRSKMHWENKLSPETPPPAYYVTNNTVERYTPSTPSTVSFEDKYVTTSSPPTTMLEMSTTASPPLSARSSSFSHTSWAPSSRRASKGKGNKRLPRLMSVCDTFVPSLSDELPIKLNEVVRLLEEFTDGWCLVQRVGRRDAPQGAIPRFCIQERPEVIPAHGQRVSYTTPYSHSKLPIQGNGRTRVLSVADFQLTPEPF